MRSGGGSRRPVSQRTEWQRRGEAGEASELPVAETGTRWRRKRAPAGAARKEMRRERVSRRLVPAERYERGVLPVSARRRVEGNGMSEVVDMQRHARMAVLSLSPGGL